MKLAITTAAALELVTTTPVHAASEMASVVKATRRPHNCMPSERAARSMKLKTVDQLTSTEFMAACKDDAFKISFYRA
jgi:hypothetical protein